MRAPRTADGHRARDGRAAGRRRVGLRHVRPGHAGRAHVRPRAGPPCPACRIIGSRAPHAHALVAFTAAGHTIRLRVHTCVHGVTLSLSPFQPVLPERTFHPTRFLFRASILGHPHARRGTTLVYRVRLRNESGRPFRFPWCPLFNERVGLHKGRFYKLDCRPAGTIEPGKSVVFVMHFPLSPHFRPGTRTLVWELENEVGVRQARASAELRIDG